MPRTKTDKLQGIIERIERQDEILNRLMIELERLHAILYKYEKAANSEITQNALAHNVIPPPVGHWSHEINIVPCIEANPIRGTYV